MRNKSPLTLKKEIGVLYSHTTPLVKNLVHIKHSTIQFDLVGKGLSARLVTKICLIQKVDRSPTSFRSFALPPLRQFTWNPVVLE